MASASESRTRASLLRAVRDYGNAQAWAAFTVRYEGLIRGWCRRKGLRHADEDEVVQAILAKLVVKLFDYDPEKGGFRHWLAAAGRERGGGPLARGAAPARRPGQRRELGSRCAG